MKMEPIVSSETSAIRTQTPGNYPKRNNLHLEHGESLRTRVLDFHSYFDRTTRMVELLALDPAALYPHGDSLVLTTVRG